MPRIALQSRRTRTSCSILALATVMAVGATPASAQSFNGTGSFTSNGGGVANINNSVANTTTVTLNPGQTVIDWAPNTAGSGNIIFQPVSTTATFNSTADFAVLNNINGPISRAIEMNGTVNARISGNQGGSVYFYAPGGFVFGGTSVFNVGSLVVSALPIQVTAGSFISGAGRTVTFGQAPNPAAQIVMNGNINAFVPALGFGNTGPGYVGIIAPKVVQNSTSTINANGSTALVAAEAATLSFSPDGLFDIQVGVGSTSATGIEVYGNIGGETPTGGADQQRVFLVGVPKNDAMTMVIGSGADLGFTLANSALDDNGVIVLSAGHDIDNGVIVGRSAGHGAAATGNFNFVGGHATSNVVADATGTANIYAVSPSLTTTFDNSLTVHADGNINVSSSGAGASVSIADNLSLSADRVGGTGQSITGGTINLLALNTGSVNVGGTISINADAIGGDSASGTAGGGTGGTINITAGDGSTLNFGALSTSATGTGGNATAGGVVGGAGTGGTITMTATNGGTVNMTNPLLFDVQGYGGSGGGSGAGGAGTGGTARIQVGDTSTLTFSGDAQLLADGFGGGSGSGTGGAGTGGTAELGAVFGSSSGGLMTFNGEVLLSAEGEGGASNSGTGGAGTGGLAQLTSNAHHVVLNDFTWVRARGQGGSSSSGNGGNGLGGTAQIVASGSSELDSSADVTLTTSGFGGQGVTGGTGTGGNANIRSQSDVALTGTTQLYVNGNGGNGGIGDAGTIHVEANGGDLSLGTLQAFANGNGGESFQGSIVSGNGLGGDIFVQAFANSALSVANNLLADSDGAGGQTGFQVDAGNGTGGHITVQASGDNSSLFVGGNANLSADGSGGFGLGDCFSCGRFGGDGFGGVIHVGADGADLDLNESGASISVVGSLSANADGYGGTGLNADGGFGKGGEVKVSAGNGATLDVGDQLEASADGFGGARDEDGYGGDLDAFAGDGEGGFVELFSWGSGAPDINILTVDMHADGWGGSTSVNGAPAFGGDGLGGIAWMDAQIGTIDIAGDAIVTASGHGGTADFGTGGDGTGRNAELDAFGTGGIAIGGSVEVDASGIGGSGQTGGNGLGGGELFADGSWIDGAIILTWNGSINIGFDASISSSGRGGDGSNGGDGGNGTGGLARVQATNSNLGPSSLTINDVESTTSVLAEGYGGAGGQGASGNTGGNGGNGGDAFGGIAALFGSAGNGTVTVNSADLSAQAFGGAGGNGGNGDGGAGGSGGEGGNATGGNINVGTGSGNAQALGSNLGSGNYGSINADASATGGRGGDGNFGSIGGNGGDGGDAFDGGAYLLVRGSVVNVDDVTLLANATGGAAGFGYFMEGGPSGTTGIGGDATVGGDGGIGVLVTNRFQIPSQRGTLNAGSITGTATAAPGIGIPDGASIFLGGNQVSFINSEGTIGSLAFEVGLGINQSISGKDFVSLVGSNLTADTFSFDTAGNLALYVDQSLFDVGTLALGAGNFVFDGRTPVATGLITADTVNITTDDDFVANANWDVTNTFLVDAPGLIALDFVHDDNGIDFSAGGSISVDVNAGTYVDLLAGGNINTSDIDAGSSVRLESTGGSIDVGNIDANSFVTLIADTFIHGEDISTFGNIFAQTANGDISLENLTSTFGSVTLDSGDDIFLVAGDDPDLDGDIFADGDIRLTADGLIDMNDATGGYFEAQASSTFDSLDLTSDTDIRIDAGDDVTVGHLVAGLPVSSSKAIRIISDGSVSLIDINALGGIDITAAGNVTGGAVTTGDGLFTDAVGSITYGNISAGLVNPQTPSEFFSVGLAAGTSINAGTIEAALGIALISPGTVMTGDLTTGTDILGLAHGNMTIGDVSASDRVYLADYSMYADVGGVIPTNDTVDASDIESIFAATPVRTGGSITVGQIDAGSFQAAAGTGLTIGALNADSDLSLDAGGAITTGNLTVGNFVLANGGSITTGDIDADSIDMTSTAGNITTGDIFAFGAVALDAFGDIIAGDILAGSIDLLAGDDITTGDLSTQIIFQLAMEGPGPSFLFPGASITLESGGDIATGDISSIDGVFADAGGALSTGAIDAFDFVQLEALNNITTGDVDAGSYINIFSNAGAIDTGDLAGTDIELDAAGAISFDDVDGYDFDFSAGGAVNGGNIIVTERVSGDSAGTVTLGNIAAGPIVPFDDFSVGIAAIGNISVGNVSGAGPVGFATQGNLTTGNLSSSNLVMTLVGGNTTTGSITTTGGGGQVYMADDSMFLTGGGTLDGEGDFDASIVLALGPVPTGGSITINGPVTTGLFQAAAGTGLTTQAITANEIQASAGGTATLSGVWNSPDVSLTSHDIAIGTSGGISAGTGSILLHSSNSGGVLLGDGLSGSGWALSNAEFAKISGGDITVVAGGLAGVDADSRVGDLTITAGPSGNIRTADGGLALLALNEAGTDKDGTIRVVGDINGTGFTNTNYLAFAADTFELDAATGGISLTSTGSTLGGELDLYADRIHVASGAILDQLAANPTYTGYQDDLNETAATQRPEGVLRVDTLWIESDNLQDVLIQNTGTFGSNGTPAGFLVRQAFINDDEEVAGPPGSINLIVNGQVVTEGGTLTGVEARDALVTEETDITPFTANSTINGCPLTGQCIIRPPAPPPVADVVDNQIDLIFNDPLGDSEFGNEDSIDDNEDGDEGADNPIAPPQPLFDTRPLIPSSEVNDPVSGTGNPALLGGDQCEEDENGQCPVNPVKGDSQ